MTKDAMQQLRQVLLDAGIPHVYVGDLPELREDCVALRPVDGYPSTLYLGMPETLEPLVEVLFRVRDYAIGESWYNEAIKVLNKYSNEEAGIMICVVTGSPGYLGRDTNGFGEWHMILHVTIDKY